MIVLPVLWHRLDVWWRKAVPFCIAVGLIVLGVVPWPLPGLSSVAPLFGLIVVHYWTVHQPSVVPVGLAFLLGLVHDVLGGGPIGLNALVLILAHTLISTQRRHLGRGPFVVDWCGFAMVAAGAVALTWAVASIYYAQLLGGEPLVVQYLLTICAYPLFAWIFAGLRQRLFRNRSDAAGI